jgi:DNA gyrase subunit A
VPNAEGDILTATENGYGKRTPIGDYPAKSRATKGVVSIKVSERNGAVVGAVQVDENDEIMLISDQGTLVRTRAAEVSTVGRNTQGVTLIRTVEGEHVVGLQRIDEVEDVEQDAEGVDAIAEDADLQASTEAGSTPETDGDASDTDSDTPQE